MSKFKVGDGAKVLRDATPTGEYIGKRVTVAGVLNETTVEVRFDGGAQLLWNIGWLEAADPQTAEPRRACEMSERRCKCGAQVGKQEAEAYEGQCYPCWWKAGQPAAAQANQGALVNPNGPVESYDALARRAEKQHFELARLRKELEQATSLIAKRADYEAKGGSGNITVDFIPCDHEATVSKLRDFSEGQARQIAGLEVAIGEVRDECNRWASQANEADILNGRLTRELEKLKRGRK